MIKIIGTNHEEFRRKEFDIENRHRLSNFDKIFTEGFSQEGFDDLVNFIMLGLPADPDLRSRVREDMKRGPEPIKFDSIDEEVIYLDDEVSDKVLEGMEEASSEEAEGDAYPLEFLGEKIADGQETREDYIEFMQKIRDFEFDVDGGYSSYAALSRDGFQSLMDELGAKMEEDVDPRKIDREIDIEEIFQKGLEDFDITLEDYQNVYAESRQDFQDKRDQEWYEQITGQIDEEDNLLIVTGIHHALQTDETLASLLSEEYEVNVAPYHNNW